MSNTLIVKTAYANIYSEPSFGSQMVTQALFFEELEIKSEHNNWYKINQWDGYTGYIHKFYLSNTYNLDDLEQVFISDRFKSLYSSLDFNEEPSIIIPFGAIILAKEHKGALRTTSIDGNSYYLKPSIVNNIKDVREQIIHNSKKLLGSPYLWGGKTPFGYDCSGFVQSIYNSVGFKIRRDTSEQINESKMMDIDFKNIDKGDLIFFSIEGEGVDHVGIWCGEDSIIHCGGELKLQSIYDDSSLKLSDYILKVRSLSGMLDGN